jgi:CRISPR-associated exonuclease Cas4
LETMPYTEEQLLPISALQHLRFCERQCALIHIEQVWSENRFTVEGQHLHEHVHERGSESRGKIRTETGLALRSLELGLSGIADVVEFHRQEDASWLPFPVEYKRGKPKQDSSDEVQLCAQAICLEEMLDCQIPCGALFYGKTRRRKQVAFDPALRELTAETARQLHALIAGGITPPPLQNEPKCSHCSLQDLCMPKRPRQSVADYIAANTSDLGDDL